MITYKCPKCNGKPFSEDKVKICNFCNGKSKLDFTEFVFGVTNPYYLDFVTYYQSQRKNKTILDDIKNKILGEK